MKDNYKKVNELLHEVKSIKNPTLQTSVLSYLRISDKLTSDMEKEIKKAKKEYIEKFSSEREYILAIEKIFDNYNDKKKKLYNSFLNWYSENY